MGDVHTSKPGAYAVASKPGAYAVEVGSPASRVSSHHRDGAAAFAAEAAQALAAATVAGHASAVELLLQARACTHRLLQLRLHLSKLAPPAVRLRVDCGGDGERKYDEREFAPHGESTCVRGERAWRRRAERATLQSTSAAV